MKITFNELPKTVEEVKAYGLSSPHQVAALAVAALTLYEEDREAMFSILEYLRGPQGPLSLMEKQFIADRFADGQVYVAYSFFEGATPENDYEPTSPYSIEVSENPYSYDNEHYARLLLTSGGADSQRPVMLREKPSTGQWFFTDNFGFLAGIRKPISKDEWA